MKAAPYIKTPEMNEEILLKQKEYITKYNYDSIKIMIGETKDNIIIRSTYYEIKLNIEDLSLLTKILFKSVDESFEFIKNIFEQNKYIIKEKSSKEIKLILKVYDIFKGREKDIELILKENFENQNILIKDLFNKYMNIEKEIYELKNENKKLKEENNKLKQDNNSLKMEIEIIKNKQNNDIGGLQMEYMNLINSMNVIQQQINQFIIKINEIEQIMNIREHNNFNNMNQNNFDPMNDINNLNMMNQNNFNNTNNINSNFNIINPNNYNPLNDSLNNSIQKKTKEIIVYFRIIKKNNSNIPIAIQCQDDDLVSELKERFRALANYENKYAKFIYNARNLIDNLTVIESGINNSSNIFVVDPSDIIFKIYGTKNLCFHLKIGFSFEVSHIIDSFISESGLNHDEILKYEYNSKILNENMTIEEAGLEEKSEIIVFIKNKLDYINIYFKSINNSKMNSNENKKVECLKNEKIGSLLYRYKCETDNIRRSIKFSFNSKEILDHDEDKNIKEFGLKNKSIIIADFEELWV